VAQPHCEPKAHWKEFACTFQYNFASGRPFFQNPEFVVDSTGANIFFDELLSERVPDYYRVNFSLRTMPIVKT
jgi:hypothetical protein